MGRNRAVYVLFLVGCIIFSAAYKSRIASIILIAAVIYPVIALLLTAISILFVQVRFDEKRAVYEKNQPFELPVQILNNFLFPYTPAELDCLIPDNDTGLFLRKQIYAAAPPLKKMRIFVPCMHRYRGSYSAKILKISVFDPLKIIRISRKADAQIQLIFLPRKITLQGLSAVFGGKYGARPEPSLSCEKEDFSHVREYTEGDLVQLIHWKLTAKLDELMIKQYDADGDKRNIILCNFGQYGATSSAIMKRSDAVIETAVAVAMSAVEHGSKALADTGAYSDGSCDISDSAGFRRFFDMMSVIPPNLPVIDFPELVDKYSAGGAQAMFLITPVLNESILSATERAAERLSGTVVLMYVNCSDKTHEFTPAENSRYVFAEINGEIAEALPDAAEQIIADYEKFSR